ncbi:PQQ-dependent sugar dehydrogenase [Candidatus Pelagibacter sp.]|nr:PQQ-dependent sugar dehydrogenase [Candidatus Pelagibacter sp.]
MKFKKLYLILFLILIILTGGLLLAPYTLNQQDGILYHVKQLIPEKLKIMVKKNFLGKKLLQNEINDLKLSYEKNILDEYILNVSQNVNLINSSKILSKKKIEYSFKEIYLPFKSQHFHGGKPGGYLEKYNNKLIIASGDAKFISIDVEQLENKEIKINKINNNFRDIVKNKEIYLKGNEGIRDLEIIDDHIYLSYPKFIEEKESSRKCFTLGILVAKVNFDFLNFSEFASLDKCPNGSWGSTRSGGRLEGNKNKIYLTIGDFGDMIPNQASQDKKSFYGKIISIDRNNSDKKEIISMGHRNPQGLVFDNNKNFLLSSEHGPDGGDEVNLINLNNNEIKNFGWPISSYGNHYQSTILGHHDTNTYPEIAKYAPLHKSHKKYGFIEPLINWTPSIGVSQIVLDEIDGQKKIIIAAMGNNIPEGDRTVHEYTFSENYDENLDYDKIILGERIRDMIYDKRTKELILILENTPKLGILQKLDF